MSNWNLVITLAERAEHPLDWWWFSIAALGIVFILYAIHVYPGGWHALSVRYRHAKRPAGECLFRLATIHLGLGFFPLGYRESIFASIGSDGITISKYRLFRYWSPPLLIPWSAVSECKRETRTSLWTLFGTATAVYLSEPQTRLLFPGTLGRAIYAFWSREIKHSENC
jgi:hypothetical protein